MLWQPKFDCSSGIYRGLAELNHFYNCGNERQMKAPDYTYLIKHNNAL
jgi:hypothetical protein